MHYKSLFILPFALSLYVHSYTALAASNNGKDQSVEYHDSQFVEDEIQAIERVTKEWAKKLNAREPLQIAALYDDNFMLYATFETQIKTREALLNYFTNLMKNDSLKVVFNEQTIRAYGSVALNSGLYTFSYKKDGKMVNVDARYTFVYALTPVGWRIVDHHSSVLPN